MSGYQKKEPCDLSKAQKCMPENIYMPLEHIKPDTVNPYLRLYRYTCVEKVKDEKKAKPLLCIKAIDFASHKSTFENLNNRVESILKTVPYSRQFSVAQQSRWAIGTGGASPYGNLLLLTLHPIYGVPYIPASTLKGLTRRCWIDENCEENDSGNEVLRMFGSSADELSSGEQVKTGQTGKLMFFDSYPHVTGIGKLVKDVFTPHYPDYYGKLGCVPPTDDQNPIPIEFLCLEGFKFTVYIGAQTSLSDDEEKKLKNVVISLFSRPGVGAKTALGYGRGWAIMKQ